MESTLCNTPTHTRLHPTVSLTQWSTTTDVQNVVLLAPHPKGFTSQTEASMSVAEVTAEAASEAVVSVEDLVAAASAEVAQAADFNFVIT